MASMYIFAVMCIMVTYTAKGEATEDENHCPFGQPKPGYFCGRGPTRRDCPYGYYCKIDPADIYAVCCKNVCEIGVPLDGYFCGRGPNRRDCPQGYICNIHETDLYAVCCPLKEEETTKVTRSTNPSSATTSDVTESLQTTDNVKTMTSSTTIITMARKPKPLYCYQCSDAEADQDCQENTETMSLAAGRKLGQMVEEGNQNGDDYITECNNLSLTYCMTETIINKDIKTSYKRGCSDGKTFSYDLPKLLNVLPDNQTTCSYHAQGFSVCVTVCQSSFCNGPTPAAGNDPSFNVFLILSVIILQILS